MNIKGTAVKTTPDFINAKFPGKYDEWFNTLPEKSKKIFEAPIYSTHWYSLQDAVLIPTEKAGELFFESNEEAARELGKYSAEIALKGVYKIFVRINTPNFVLSRASSVFSSYYDEGMITSQKTSSKSAVLHIKNFEAKDILIMSRIAGWLEKTLEITSGKDVNVTVENEFKDENLITKMTTNW